MGDEATGTSYVRSDLFNGRFVTQGELLGYQGDDGTNSGDIVHLHLTVSDGPADADDIDPTPYLSVDVNWPRPPADMAPISSNCGSLTFTTRVSVDSAGGEANSASGFEAISADGQYVAFWSNASDLVPGDTNGRTDVFVHDRQTGITQRVSVDSAGNQGDGNSVSVAISADGRYVAFDSDAANLVPGDTNGALDVFVHDRQTGATERMNVDGAGNQANGYSYHPAISADGRWVAFASNATNLVPGDTDGILDVFVHDGQTGVTERVGPGGDNPTISADGRYVAFWTALALVPQDTNQDLDIYLRDRVGASTSRVSVASDGSQANWESLYPAISADGRYVAFRSSASNLVPGDTNNWNDIFVHDRQTGITERVSVDSAGDEGNIGSSAAAISADGRYVAFLSGASNLVPDDTNNYSDVFIHDRQTGVTERVSVDSAGNQGDDNSVALAVSHDGRYVAFLSLASNLVPADTNAVADVFVRDRGREGVTVEAGAGQTVTTGGTDGATAWDSVLVSVTTPNAGTVSIDETPITGTPPADFQFLAQQIDITAPAATAGNPLVLVFSIDSSKVPVGQNHNTVQIVRGGALVPACAGSPGTASPDPCVSNRALVTDGDVQITVLTSTASTWNFAAPTAPSSAVGGIAELPDIAEGAGPSAADYVAVSAAAAAGALTLTAGAWYARRRRLR